MNTSWPRAGDHLRVDRGGYYHHGILVPGSPPPERALVRRCKAGIIKRQIRDDIDLVLEMWRAGLFPDVVHYVKAGGVGKGVLKRTRMADFFLDAPRADLVTF